MFCKKINVNNNIQGKEVKNHQNIFHKCKIDLKQIWNFLVYILTAFSPDPNSLANSARITSDWWLLRFRNFPEASWKSPKLVPSQLWHLLCSLFWDSRIIYIVYFFFFCFSSTKQLFSLVDLHQHQTHK